MWQWSDAIPSTNVQGSHVVTSCSIHFIQNFPILYHQSYTCTCNYICICIQAWSTHDSPCHVHWDLLLPQVTLSQCHDDHPNWHSGEQSAGTVMSIVAYQCTSINMHMYIFIWIGLPHTLSYPWRACTAQVAVLSLSYGQSICLLPRFLPLRATRRPNPIPVLHWFRKSTAFKRYGVKQERKGQSASEYCLSSAGNAVLHTVEASENTQKSSHESKTAFKCYLRIQLYPVGARNDQLWALVCGLYLCVYIRSSRMHVYNYSTRGP